jgi:hypothetical protein
MVALCKRTGIVSIFRARALMQPCHYHVTVVGLVQYSVGIKAWDSAKPIASSC